MWLLSLCKGTGADGAGCVCSKGAVGDSWVGDGTRHFFFFFFFCCSL